MIHLAYNATPLNPGGGMTGLLGYLRAWSEINAPLRVSVYASYPETIKVLNALELDLDVEVIPFATDVSMTRRMWLQCTRMPGMLKRNGADLVMSTNIALPRCPIPQVTHHRNLWTLFSTRLRDFARFGKKRVFQALWARHALKASAANLFISEYLRDQAEKIAPASQPRNHVVYNGLDSAALALAAQGCDEWDGRPEIVAVQAPSPHKDNETLLAMMAALVRMRPSVDWKLSIAGPGDWSVWKSRAAEMGLADQVDFVGLCTMDQLDVLYRRSLCLVFPSRFEGFGNPPVEAMARGCAVVASKITAMPEVIGDAGILPPAGDAEAFAEGVISLLEDRVLRPKCVATGHQRAMRFKWANSAGQMMDIFDCVKESRVRQ